MKTFTLKTDFFDNETIICIGGQFGAIGILTVVRLLCAIHRSGYYLTWSEKTAYSLQRDIPGLDRKTLNRIVKRLIHWKMFDAAMFKKHSVLTSIDLQQRYFKAAGRRRRALQSPEPIPYLLIPLQPEPQPQPAPNNETTTTNQEQAQNSHNETTPTPQTKHRHQPTAPKTTITATPPTKTPPKPHQPFRPTTPTHLTSLTSPTTLRSRTIPINRIFRQPKHPHPSSTKPHHQPLQSSASFYGKMPRR